MYDIGKKKNTKKEYMSGYITSRALQSNLINSKVNTYSCAHNKRKWTNKLFKLE